MSRFFSIACFGSLYVVVHKEPLTIRRLSFQLAVKVVVWRVRPTWMSVHNALRGRILCRTAFACVRARIIPGTEL